MATLVAHVAETLCLTIGHEFGCQVRVRFIQSPSCVVVMGSMAFSQLSSFVDSLLVIWAAALTKVLRVQALAIMST